MKIGMIVIEKCKIWISCVFSKGRPISNVSLRFLVPKEKKKKQKHNVYNNSQSRLHKRKNLVSKANSALNGSSFRLRSCQDGEQGPWLSQPLKARPAALRAKRLLGVLRPPAAADPRAVHPLFRPLYKLFAPLYRVPHQLVLSRLCWGEREPHISVAMTAVFPLHCRQATARWLWLCPTRLLIQGPRRGADWSGWYCFEEENKTSSRNWPWS